MIDKVLKEMRIDYINKSLIQTKDGVSVYRINCVNQSYVLKYFMNEEYRREIDNYIMLNNLGIKTIQLVAYTKEAILMEDIGISEKYRLAIQSDMEDPIVCSALATWYQNLHIKGYDYIKNYGSNMYMEADYFTLENIEYIKNKTNTMNNYVWKIIDENYEHIVRFLNETKKTITYNDFYYTNMIVAKDKSEAFMFDYNLLGKGYAASDIKNVTVALSEDGKEAFVGGYGKVDKVEVILHEVIGTVATLFMACNKESFPEWAIDELDNIKNGTLLNYVQELLFI